MSRFIDANIEFFQSSGLITGASGIFFKDIHLEKSLSLSEIDNSQLSGLTAMSIVGALNELKDSPGGSNPVDGRTVSGAIIPDASGIYPLGNFDLPFSQVVAVSGIFADRIRFDPKGKDPTSVNVIGDIWLRQNRSQYETLAVVGESGIFGIRNDQGLFCYHSTLIGLAASPNFTNIPLDVSVIHDAPYYVIEEDDTIVLVTPGIYRITYSMTLQNITAGDAQAVARVLLNDAEITHSSGCGIMSPIGEGDFHYISNSFLIDVNTYDKIKVQGSSQKGVVGAQGQTNISIQLLRYDSP